MKKIKLALLKNELEEDHLLWQAACEERKDTLEWEVIDLTRNDWLEKVKTGAFDGLLARPPALTNSFKQLYDERTEILHTICQIPIYPSLQEIKIYENKKYLSYWLAANDIPHPRTDVFYYQQEALDFVKTTTFPLVGKTNIGASGRGVYILKNWKEASNYIKRIFSGRGAKRSIGPRWRKNGFAKRIIKKLLHLQEFKSKLDIYARQLSEKQKDFVLFQEFIPHQYEWRCVRIGDSFFAHQKVVKGEKASGHLIKNYKNPPLEILDFVRRITDRHQLLSQAIDIFETGSGRYLVNEMQCIFGQSDPYQMLVDGKPGRFRRLQNKWILEEGDFTRLKSFALRLEHFLSIISKENVEVV